MKNKKIKLTKKTKLSELIEKHPKASDILMEQGMFCAGCPMAAQETLEEAALAHGIPPEKFIKQIKDKLK